MNIAAAANSKAQAEMMCHHHGSQTTIYSRSADAGSVQAVYAHCTRHLTPAVSCSITPKTVFYQQTQKIHLVSNPYFGPAAVSATGCHQTPKCIWSPLLTCDQQRFWQLAIRGLKDAYGGQLLPCISHRLSMFCKVSQQTKGVPNRSVKSSGRHCPGKWLACSALQPSGQTASPPGSASLGRKPLLRYPPCTVTAHLPLPGSDCCSLEKWIACMPQHIICWCVWLDLSAALSICKHHTMLCQSNLNSLCA